MEKNKTRNKLSKIYCKHSKIHSKLDKSNCKPFLIIFLTSFFAFVFILTLLPGCRLLFPLAAVNVQNSNYVNNSNNSSNSRVWEESIISMNNTLAQFAADSARRYACSLKDDKRISGADLAGNTKSYLTVLALLSKYNSAIGDFSFSEGDGNSIDSIYSAALYSFCDNLAEQVKLFKNKTGKTGAESQKDSESANDTARQQEDNTGQTESQESSGQEQPPSQQQNQQPEEQAAQEQQTTEQPAGTSGQASDFTAVLISLINNARNSNGLASLSLNSTLNNIGKIRCDDMIARDYFSHISPDGKDLKAVLAENGVMYQIAGENIQYCFPPSMAAPELFFNRWMDSQTHRANILGSGYTQIGIALSFSADKAIATLVFLG